MIAPRHDFPLLGREIEGRPIIYLDSAATSLKPRSVIDAVVDFYERIGANIHRGNHTLSQEASQLFEATRDIVARFINANAREIVFTANTTESINIIAEGLGLRAGDNVVTSILEHHSNLLPWLNRCEVRYLPEGDDGTTDTSRLEDLIDDHTKLVALSQVSNVTGAVNRLTDAVEVAHRRGVPVLFDGAQSVPHLPIDVCALGCDFLAFSAHKMLGPSGVGVLFLSESAWERIDVSKLGGGTVSDVRRDGFELKRVPHRFEAGTPNIEGIIGLGKAIEYLERIGMAEVARHDAHLARLMTECFAEIPGVTLLGPRDPAKKIAIASLVPARVDAETLGMMLCDSYKVMARAGTHCAHPFFRSHGAPGSLRFSAYLYTSDADVTAASDALREVLAQIA